MTIATLLADLEARGVVLQARNDQLWFHPRSAVPSELIDRLRQFKPDLLDILRRPEASGGDPVCSADPDAELPSPAACTPSRCAICGRLRRGSEQHSVVGGGQCYPATETPQGNFLSDGSLLFTDGTVVWLELDKPDGYVSLARLYVIDHDVADIEECPNCGGILAWWDMLGRRHCETCEPRKTAEALRNRAACLRAKYEHLAEQRECRDGDPKSHAGDEGEC
ncbi:MAG: hypothetical protein NTY19_03545 [Planctomycetota bacterium]|nr:hypothetical protein [Planctomycetota bacterium]